MKLPLSKFILIFTLVLSLTSFTFAQSDRERGIEFYQKGDYQSAVTNLKKATSQNSNDIIAAHYLGLSMEKANQIKQAIEIFENNVDNTLNLMAETLERKFVLDKQQTVKETVGDYLRKMIGNEINAAVESFQRLEELNAKESASVKWQTKTLTLHCFAKKAKTEEKEDTESRNKVSVQIKNKPIAEYTDSARSNRTNGTIKLWTLFLENGRIGLVVPINRLPDGLTKSAMDAAKNIKFEPALRDGKPVSVVKQIEYSFRTF